MSKRSHGPASSPGARVSRHPNGDSTDLEPRRHPRQDRARATVAAITEAAEQLIVEHSYAKVSTNLIARRAGVSVGSLYQYFPNKEAIFAAILEGHAAEMKALGEQALVTMADHATPFPVALRRVLESMVDVRRRDDELMQALAVELSHACPGMKKSAEEEDALVERIAAIVAARPDCRTTNPTVAARLVLTACQGVTKWLLHRAPRDLDSDAYVDLTVQMCEMAVGIHDSLAGGDLG